MFLFREYDLYHNGNKLDYKKMTIVEARQAYREFYKAGFVHSFEVWHDGRLVGGFYGSIWSIIKNMFKIYLWTFFKYKMSL